MPISGWAPANEAAHMTLIGLVQILIFIALVALIAPFLGNYMAKVFSGERVFTSPVIRPVERALYKLGGIREDNEQHWLGYLIAVMLFTLAGIVATYVLLRTQSHLPFNPDNQSDVK